MNIGVRLNKDTFPIHFPGKIQTSLDQNQSASKCEAFIKLSMALDVKSFGVHVTFVVMSKRTRKQLFQLLR